MGERGEEEARFRRIFRRAHADHARCADDEWLMAPCRDPDGSEAGRPLVWSRRNGPWRQVDVLWVGAAPGNAGGRGEGRMGAHGTRIPFGGDIAGANLDILLEAAGLDRNGTYIVAASNQLPDRGGGEPTRSELERPVGSHPTSLHVLRDTLIAAGPRLVVALGNVALRATIGAGRLEHEDRFRLPGLKRLAQAGARRGTAVAWPEAFGADAGFRSAWHAAWADRPLPSLLWLLHPSAQNMSPYAGPETVFHRRMVETRDAVRRAVGGPARQRRDVASGTDGIYALPEWRESIGPRHAELVALWMEKGL